MLIIKHPYRAKEVTCGVTFLPGRCLGCPAMWAAKKKQGVGQNLFGEMGGEVRTFVIQKRDPKIKTSNEKPVWKKGGNETRKKRKENGKKTAKWEKVFESDVLNWNLGISGAKKTT